MLFLSFLTLFFYHGEPNLYAPVSDFPLFDRDGRTWVEFGKHSAITNKTAVAIFFLLKGSVITTVISLGFHLIQLFKKTTCATFHFSVDLSSEMFRVRVPNSIPPAGP